MSTAARRSARSAACGPASATTRSTGPRRRRASATSGPSASSPSSRTTCARTTSSTAASAGRCRTGAAATSTTRTPPAGRSTTSPSPIRSTTRSCRPGTARWSSWRSRRARWCRTTPRSGFAFEPSPTQWSPYEAGLWAMPAQGLRQVGRPRARAGRALRGALRRRRPCAGWLWELWNEPDIAYWRGTAEQFHALYDVTAAAVKAALPDAAVGGPATTGDLGPGRQRPRVPARLPRALRAARRRRSTSSRSTPRAARFTPWRVYGPLGGPAPDAAVALQPQDAARGSRGARRRERRTRGFAICPASSTSATPRSPPTGASTTTPTSPTATRSTSPVFQCKLMKKLLDLDARSGARVHQATTWSFYFEGERFFEGTRSLFTAQGIEKPVLNAYRMLSRLGDTRLAVESSHAWSLERLDDGEAAMPEEIDALATAGRDGVSVLVWRHADDQYATDARDADVVVRLERLPFGGPLRVSHWRIDARAQQQPRGVASARRPPGPLGGRPAGHRGAPAARARRARPDRDRAGRRADVADRAAAARRVADRDPPRELTIEMPAEPSTRRHPGEGALPCRHRPRCRRRSSSSSTTTRRACSPRSGGTGCRSSASSPSIRGTVGSASPSPRPGPSSRTCCGIRAARCWSRTSTGGRGSWCSRARPS